MCTIFSHGEHDVPAGVGAPPLNATTSVATLGHGCQALTKDQIAVIILKFSLVLQAFVK